MRKLLLLLPLLCYGQTSNFPASLDNDRSLFITADNVQSTLSAAATAGDTSLTVSNGTGFAANQIATICDVVTNTGKCTVFEHMLITNVASSVLTVTRGFAGTSARAHTRGATISILIDAAHHQSLKDAVIKIETLLGSNGSNIYGYVDSSKLAFAAQTPGGSLSAGAQSITLTPCPTGVNGSDANHYLYISGGTGTAEAVPIIGGTCTSGGTSGTVIVTVANSHSGAWTIRSATAGIREAFIHAASLGLGVYTPSGTYNIFATLYNDAPVAWWGDGVNTIVQQQFVGDGIIIGPGSFTGNFVSIRNLKAVYGLGLGTFATTGSLWTFRNLADGHISGLDSFLGFVGFNFAGSLRVKYSQMYANAKSIAYAFSNTAVGNAGQVSNFYGTVQQNGIYVLIDPTVAGLSLSNFLLESGETGTTGLYIRQNNTGAVNELQITNGNVDNCDLNALALPYSATTGQNTGSTWHISNVRFTNKSSSTQPVANINYPGFGMKITGSTFINYGTGDGIVIAGQRRGTWVGNTVDVSDTSARLLVLQAASGGEVNSDVMFEGNQMGFNGGAVPTTGIATDSAAHTKVRFVGNQINGAISWAATGASNWLDSSNQGLTVPSVASAATITITPAPIQIITGTTQITTINGGVQGQTITLIFTNASPGGVGTGGNIARTQAAVQNQAIRLTYNGSTWY